jgi:hypothetical protein
MILLNIVWPAIYVFDELWRVWYLVFMTIAIETLIINLILKYPIKKSFWAALIGNLVSGVIGTFIMMWIMLVWHLIADNFVPHSTFDIINWIVTYILMCLGSVFIEILTIKKLFKDSIKRLFIPLLIGNLLTYSFISFTIATKTDKDPREKRTKLVWYYPIKKNYILLDSTKLLINKAKTEISYDKEDKILNTNYRIEIPFKKENPDIFQFEVRSLDDGNISENQKDKNIIYIKKLSDTLKIVLIERNPNPKKGWTAPIVSDTISFIKK